MSQPIQEPMIDHPSVESETGTHGRCWIVCRFLGEPSEVWLHRQIRGIRRFDPEVLCWRYRNREQFPVAEDRLREFPFDPFPTDGSGRWKLRLENLFRGGNFYGTVGAERSELSAAVRQSAPRVMLAHYGQVALRMLPISRQHRIPLVAHFHGLDLTGSLHNPWYRVSLGRSVRKFAALVVVADYQREVLLDLGADAERIHVIPCGVPVVGTRQSEAVGDPCCRFLSVGRFADKKAPLSVVKAFEVCAKECADVMLTMVGDGPLLEEARELAARSGLAGKIEFTGVLPPEGVIEQLARASVFVQHSVTAKSGDKEGWPVSIAEAMSAGLPVVATRHAGITDQVDPGVNGQLVEEHDWQAMGAEMAVLAKDAKRRVEFGRNARDKAVRCFDLRSSLDRLEQVLEEVSHPE